jgi:hypothetical protein
MNPLPTKLAFYRRPKLCMPARVTRLGEFSPIGHMLLWVVKITEITQIMGLLFSTVKVVY